MKHTLLMTLALSLAVFIPAAVAQEDASPRPEPAPAADASAPDTTALEAEVIEVKGQVHRTLTPSEPESWVAVKVGDKLGQYTWVRAGLSSKCVLKFAERGEVIVKSASKVCIGTFTRKQDTVDAEVGLKYGAVHAAVDSSKGKNNFRVRTASNLAALAGSDIGVGTGEMGTGFQQGTGHGQLTYGNGLMRWLNPGTSQTNGENMPSEEVRNALATWLGDVTGGLTPAEQQILNDYFTAGDFGNVFGGFGTVPQNSTAGSIVSQYSSMVQVDYWSGSGVFVPPGPTNDGGSGYSYGTWSGTGIFELAGSQTGTWLGGGTWIQASGQQYAESFKGVGTYELGQQTGTFAVAGKAGYPYSSINMNHGAGTWSGEGWAGSVDVVVTRSTGGTGGIGN